MRARATSASRALALLALVLGLTCAALVHASMSGPNGEGRADGGRPHLAAAATQPLTISGHVTGLYPGARKRFEVELRNPSRRPVVVRNLRAQVGTPGAGCGSGHLRIRAERLRLMVAPRSSATAKMTAAMAAGAPEGCQLARFPLRFGADATAAP